MLKYESERPIETPNVGMKGCAIHHRACDCREAMFSRAIQIADETMVEWVRSCSISGDENGFVWALCDEHSVAVATLEEAHPAVIEAVQWLLDRELCALIEGGPAGANVILLERDG